MHRNDSTELLAGVWAHETYGRNGARGHQGGIELAAASLPTCGRVPTILERLVASDSSMLLFRRATVLAEGKKSLFAAAWHNFVYGNYIDAPFYHVLDSLTVADTLTAENAVGDMQGTADPQTAPDPQYNCTRVY
jgi:hypothetical protein